MRVRGENQRMRVKGENQRKRVKRENQRKRAREENRRNRVSGANQQKTVVGEQKALDEVHSPRGLSYTSHGYPLKLRERAVINYAVTKEPTQVS
ncbi:hypothetical protein RRG08_019737 [Elysia crispata]|uniref:Uncharacterized protein n=1 Tax=Elysia crispata TaxID=231223 RepID=A0AAE1CUC3_9GAST|nr:hypothetical protein RRG08_019737 [Elysia crispata]